MNSNAVKLSISFNTEKLLQDYTTCLKMSWSDHHNQKDYSGNWTSISLRSHLGLSTDSSCNPGVEYKNTNLLDICNYFREIISGFHCELESVRLLKLSPGSIIHEHTDPMASYEEGYMRLHIPILSNRQVEFKVNKELVFMKPGECWYVNFTLPHSVINNGNSDRIHLVIDAKRNEWSDALMKDSGHTFSVVEKKYSSSETKRILEELQNLGVSETIFNEFQKRNSGEI